MACVGEEVMQRLGAVCPAFPEGTLAVQPDTDAGASLLVGQSVTLWPKRSAIAMDVALRVPVPRRALSLAGSAWSARDAEEAAVLVAEAVEKAAARVRESVRRMAADEMAHNATLLAGIVASADDLIGYAEDLARNDSHWMRVNATPKDLEKRVRYGVRRLCKEAARAAVVQIGGHKVAIESGLGDYPSLFPAARAIKRRLRLFVGPTNSGKTHAAMDRLAAAQTGVYAAPLRLMALEGYERLIEERGVACSMVTGEERIASDGARHVACTVEMCDLDTPIDVAVIDEIQMIGDPDRGWAWTQAVVGLPAREIVMTGSADALPWIQRLAAMTGEEIEIEHFERKTPLVALPAPVPLSDVKPGDAIVAFSRRDVLRLRNTLLNRGWTVAAIYGAMPPEVRRVQAAGFRSGETQILVATDAIGMGLNLPVSRILFSAVEKYDGCMERPLSGSEIRQIGGRAGRYGLADAGYVGVLEGNSLYAVSAALKADPPVAEAPRPLVMPPAAAVEKAAHLLKTTSLARALDYISKAVLPETAPIRCAWDPAGLFAREGAPLRAIDAVEALPLRTRYRYLGIPVDARDDGMIDLLRAWLAAHAQGDVVPCPRYAVSAYGGVEALEQQVRRLTAYRWLAMRWPEVYLEYDAASAERLRLSAEIEDVYRSREAAAA